MPSPLHALAAAGLRTLCGVPILPESALPPASKPCIYFANHSSHVDFVAIWAALPASRRSRTRPVAGRDYWNQGGLRRWIGGTFFRAVLIERRKVTVATNPLQPMLEALDQGDSLIVFPEGTRSPDGRVQDFKPGLFHVARARPGVPLVPIALENLNRILPKGEWLAVPLLARIALGPPLALAPDEPKNAFLMRARRAVEALLPDSAEGRSGLAPSGAPGPELAERAGDAEAHRDVVRSSHRQRYAADTQALDP